MEQLIRELSSPLFDGIRREDRLAVLGCTGYHIAAFQKGQVVAIEEEQIHHVGIVLSGAVDMVKEDLWGGRTLLLRIGVSEMFGETFACGDDPRSMVSFLAAEDSRVLFIPFGKAMRTCAHACEFHQRLAENMVRVIANKNRELLRKVEVISKKTLREKILAYLSDQAQRSGSEYFEIPLGRVELAEYLCADRSALTRELAKMREEGILHYDRNRFRIQKQ